MTNSSKRPDATARNIFGEPLVACCFNPLTGYFRDGYCRTDRMDLGVHVVCARVTDEFLSYSKSRGNDLITARPEFNFPGLTDGDFWCLCAQRWYEAVAAGVAIFCLMGALVKHNTDVAHVSQADPALQIASWAIGGEMPSTANIIRVLGEDYVKR